MYYNLNKLWLNLEIKWIFGHCREFNLFGVGDYLVKYYETYTWINSEEKRKHIKGHWGTHNNHLKFAKLWMEFLQM